MLKQHLQFKLSQKAFSSANQLMKLIQLPTQAFEQRIKQEMEENPALESGKEESNDYDDDYRVNLIIHMRMTSMEMIPSIWTTSM